MSFEPNANWLESAHENFVEAVDRADYETARIIIKDVKGVDPRVAVAMERVLLINVSE